MQTTFQEQSKNLQEHLKHISESVAIVCEEMQGIKRESIAMRRDVLEAVGHQEAKDISDPPVGMIHSKDKNSSLAGESQLSEGKLYSFHLTPLKQTEKGSWYTVQATLTRHWTNFSPVENSFD